MLGPVLESARLRLEPPRPAHLPDFVSWFSDPGVTRYLLRRHPPSLRQEERWLEHVAASRSDVVWAVTRKDPRALVGVTALHRIDWQYRHAWIEITLGDRSTWGQGFATESVGLCTAYGFEELGLEKILASVYSGNEASLRVVARAGFRQAGVLRRHAYFGGEWHDEWLGELLREEWKTGT